MKQISAQATVVANWPDLRIAEKKMLSHVWYLLVRIVAWFDGEYIDRKVRAQATFIFFDLGLLSSKNNGRGLFLCRLMSQGRVPCSQPLTFG